MARRPLIFAAIAGTLAGGALALADRKQVIEQQKQQALAALKDKPLLDKHRIEQIFCIRREGSDLMLHAFIEPTSKTMQAKLDGLPFPATVQCSLLSRDIPQVDFQFDLDDFSNPLVSGQLHVESRPSSLQIDRNYQEPNDERIVRFSEDGTRADLSVFAGDISARANAVHMQAESFAELRRQHPLEIETYLRPILREIHQEAALAPEPLEAWQVLADDWPVDNNLADKVKAQLPDLDNNDFRVRSKAAEQLYHLGRDGAVYMLHMDRKGLSPEQKKCLDEVVARFNPLPEPRANKLHDDLHFLADCLNCDDALVRKLALSRLCKLTGREIEFDLEAKAEARIEAANDVRALLFAPDGKLKEKS
jgi:hypothetical protein